MTIGQDSGEGESEANAWAARAEELAEWAEHTLVNRREIHGGQRIDPDGTIGRYTSYAGLTTGRPVRHFSAETATDVIGLHNTAPDETCRWVGIDIDAHDGDGSCPKANLRFARAVRNRAHRAGLAVRLLDSGGRGGYHLWVVFDGRIPMSDARRLALWLVHDWEGHGLPRRPDLFPGNHVLTGLRCGKWLRLPGRHHKRPHWTRVWSPARKIWRDGDEAIDALLSLRGRPVDVATIVPADFVSESTKVSASHRPSRPRVVPIAPTTRPERHGRAVDEAREFRQAATALEHYRNDDLDYDAWLEVGMALKDLEDDEAAFGLWDRWSEQSDKYDHATTVAKGRASGRPRRRAGSAWGRCSIGRARPAGRGPPTTSSWIPGACGGRPTGRAAGSRSRSRSASSARISVGARARGRDPRRLQTAQSRPAALRARRGGREYRPRVSSNRHRRDPQIATANHTPRSRGRRAACRPSRPGTRARSSDATFDHSRRLSVG